MEKFSTEKIESPLHGNCLGIVMARGALRSLIGIGLMLCALSCQSQKRQPVATVQSKPPPSLPPIRVGILHALTGKQAEQSRSVVDATLLAIEQLNGAGGLLGRKLETLVRDSKSDNDTLRVEAERLIAEEKVVTLFGGISSSNRKTMKQVVEKYDHLLAFPSNDEGVEDSAYVLYSGACPNQQVLPALHHVTTTLRKQRIFVVGQDGRDPAARDAAARLRSAWQLSGRYLFRIDRPPAKPRVYSALSSQARRA